MARTFEFVLNFVGCVTVTVSPNQINIIIIIIKSDFRKTRITSNLEIANCPTRGKPDLQQERHKTFKNKNKMALHGHNTCIIDSGGPVPAP